MASFNPLFFLFTLGVTLAPSPTPGAQPVVFQSPAKQVTLVELFTSEGCSSCPPADRWLAALKPSPRLWVDFVPVAFHVDYWDHLGWRDPWSAKTHTDRQKSYAAAWRSPSFYTPCFVLNGGEWRGWSRSTAGPPSSNTNAGVLKAISRDSNTWNVSFAPVAGRSRAYRGHIALLACGLISNVAAGENRGRRLEHEFVVIALVQGPLTNQGGSFQGELSLAKWSVEKSVRPAIAVWVTEASRLEPLQSAGGWLSPGGKN